MNFELLGEVVAYAGAWTFAMLLLLGASWASFRVYQEIHGWAIIVKALQRYNRYKHLDDLEYEAALTDLINPRADKPAEDNQQAEKAELDARLEQLSAREESAKVRRALLNLVGGVHAGRFVPESKNSEGYCQSLVDDAERALALNFEG